VVENSNLSDAAIAGYQSTWSRLQRCGFVLHNWRWEVWKLELYPIIGLRSKILKGVKRSTAAEQVFAGSRTSW